MKSNRNKHRKCFLGLFSLVIVIAFFCVGVNALEPTEIIASQLNAQDQSAAGFTIAAAQICTNCNSGTSTGSTASGASTPPVGLSTVLYSNATHGGYTASGVGMRDRGWGTIVLTDMPNGSTKSKAYLFWSIIGPDGVSTPPALYAQGKFNGVSITGTFVGSANSPGWNSGNGKIFGYQADVTSYVTGNNVYHLTDFASGIKYGQDPWASSTVTTYPLNDGASLVVVYSKADYPLTTIKIINGIQSFKQGTATTTFTGLPSSTLPVAKTTYIVADGASNDHAKYVTFNGKTLPTINLNGNDRQDGVNFAYGNLMDTSTAYVNMTHSANSASATVYAGSDYVVWLAQVLSVSDGNLDTDGDGLKDSWEIYGYSYHNNGVIDVPINTYGASPYHKDLFVWVDWMQAKTGETTYRHRPNATVLTTAANTFANANYASATLANNVDGTPGINLHSYVMYMQPHQDNLAISNTNWAVLDTIKNTHMTAAWKDIFHYCLFAHGYDGGSSSGISRGIPASDFIVTLGLWGSQDTDAAKTGTYIHEFGHNLGLTHGGTDHVNDKPNYISIMNYFFQTDGLYRSGHWGNYDYQRTAAYPLNENSLVEANGIGSVSSGYGTKWYCPNGTERSTTVNAPIDWNCNGHIDTSPVSVDINHDGSKTLLTPQLNWQHIVYNGGSIGGVSLNVQRVQMVTAENMPEELTYSMYVNMTKNSI